MKQSAEQIFKGKVVKLIARQYALLWRYAYRVRYHLTTWGLRHSVTIKALLLALLVGLSVYYLPRFQTVVEPYFSSEDRLASLRTLLVALGGALIGATAISFSLVLFAMQINVERMPHGLFWKFSTDRRIIAVFGAIFLMAVFIACLSLLPDPSWAALVLLSASWGIVLIFILLVYAYRRALDLINPVKQLIIIIDDAVKDMRMWARRAERARPLLDTAESNDNDAIQSYQSTHDFSLALYFQVNSHWTAESLRAIDHAISFARRYAEHGDYHVSSAALNTVVQINHSYVKTRGKTFFSNNVFFSNPLSSDAFINNTFEQFRQTLSIGFSRNDEQQIEQVLDAIVKLVSVYMEIDYSDAHATKTHANLAAGYLSEGVKDTVRHGLVDVVMQGLRKMGQVAALFLAKGEPSEISVLSDNIREVAWAGIPNEKSRPITLTGVEQFAMLTILLLHKKEGDIRFAAKELQKNVSLTAKLLLQIPDVPLVNMHSTYLTPYYSGVSTEALRSKLTELVNNLLAAETSNDTAKRIIRNIEKWADGLYRTEKELLLLAIEKKSHFTFGMIHWIAHVTKLLLAVSNAGACDKNTREKLQKHALWLISTLSFIPDDKESVAFIESFNMTETLFDVALDAQKSDCTECAEQARKMLLNWGFKAGAYPTGRGILEKSFYGLATLAMLRESQQEIDRLKSDVASYLDRQKSLDQDERNRTARDIRERAATLYQESHGLSRIDYVMSQLDHNALRILLEDLANLLSPRTAN